MASDYGLNFGFRVSDETRRSSMGRVKTPATGPLLLCGTAVEIDPANPGFLKPGDAGIKLRTGASGLLVQEEQWDIPIYGPEYVDSWYLGVCKPNRLSVITSGPGTKVWLKNTPAQNRADGRAIAATSMFLAGAGATAVAAGTGLAWDGTHWVGVADPTDPTSWGEVTYYDPTRNYLELTLSA